MTISNFRLPTLHLGTSFDEPTVPLRLPGELNRGEQKALCILDGADRAPFRLSRFVRGVGLLGIKIDTPSRAVRVKMVLLADKISTGMWDRERRRMKKEEPLRDAEGKVIPPQIADKHRLIEVTAQGKPRAVALLSFRPSDGEETRTRVEFELSAEDVGDSGLLMFDFSEPEGTPEWSQENRLPGGLTGVCVVRIEVAPVGDDVEARLSTGRPDIDGRDVAGRNPGYLVVNPSGDAAAQRLCLTPRWADDERLLGRRAKVKHPMQFAREWSADRRISTGGRATIEVVTIEGDPVLSETVKADGSGRFCVALPAGLGPVLARVRKHVGGEEPTPINWWVDVEPIG